MKLQLKPGAKVRLLATAVARPMDLSPCGERGEVLGNDDVMARVLGPDWRAVTAQKEAQKEAQQEAQKEAQQEPGAPAAGRPARPALPEVACRQWLMGNAHALDLALEAARRALMAADLQATDLAGLICVTSTPPIVSASMAARIGKALGLADGAGLEGAEPVLSQAACLDVRAGGVGVMQAWFAAQGLILQGSGPVLIVAAEAASRFLSPGDLASALLYADGAGACILGPGEAADADTFLGGLSGQMPLPGLPTTIPGLLPPPCGAPGDLPAEAPFDPKVYRFQRPDRSHLAALLELWACFPKALAQAFPEATAALRHFVPYAVTPRQMDVASTALGAPHAEVYHELDQWGCLGAASPLTALHGLLQSGRANQGDVILLASAAGNGLWAGLYWRLA